MPLATVSPNQAAQSAQLNQLINLLTGVMNDQPVTLKGDNTRAPSLLTFDSVNAAQQVATKFNDAGVTKWILGKNTDNSFFVWDATASRNVIQVQSSGGLTLMPTSGDVTIGGSARLVLGLAASKVVPGATSLSLRNNADTADNLIVTDAGAATVRGNATINGNLYMGPAVSKVIPGATSLSLRNNADSADNLILTDAGAMTVRGNATINGVGVGQVSAGFFGDTVNLALRVPGAGRVYVQTTGGAGDAPISMSQILPSAAGTGGGAAIVFNAANPHIYASSYTVVENGLSTAPTAGGSVLTKVGLTDQPYAVSFGRATASFGTGRPVQNNFTLGTAFATSILSAACGLWPLGSWNGWYMLACDRDGANVRSQVNVVIDNSNGGVTQNFSVGWMAIGY